ncbi:hypothetical protein [Microbulbifer taiwanensis]|uniref:Transposase n=1 Tax=Microbulbifer taiwanensis TaxID=986746 RepID=A0ABW1YSV6_9GAMM|nr:hypothetical protein [Microbulbifer taiwanensis]
MNSLNLHISPRMRSAQQHQLPAVARLWCGVLALANIVKRHSQCVALQAVRKTVYKMRPVTAVIT